MKKIDSVLKGFAVWTDAQGIKSKGRVKSIDNISFDGITRLREFILDLAIRGKLVTQNDGDESAHELLIKIEKEKNRLISANRIGKTGDFAKVGDNVIPFNLPKNWVWTYIRNVGHDWGQKTPNEDFTYIDVSAINNNTGEVNNPTIIKASDAPSRARKIVKKGTVIYSTVRPYLKNITVINEDFNPAPIASTAFAIIHPYLEMPGKYFYYFFRSPFFINYVESVQTGIAYPAINDKQFFDALIPLPPIEEQHRIIKKVNELMALCDKLEEQQTNNLTTHHNLVKSLLETLTKAKDADELNTSWNKFAGHFDTLFCTEDSIEQLKQTILQLAIMGRLIKQEPKDEPASELFERITKEKKRLIKEGVLREDKSLAQISEEEKIFRLPNNWEWVRLGDVAKLAGGFAYKSSLFINNGYHQVIRMGNIRPDFLRLDESPVFITEQYGAETSDYKIELGDILITMTGTKDKRDYLYSLLINSQHINNKTLYLNQRLCLLRLILIKPEFINMIIKDDRILDSVFAQSTRTANQANIGMNALRNWALPLPPIKEQERIVAKVDELIKICDTLKERISKNAGIKSTLSNAIIELV